MLPNKLLLQMAKSFWPKPTRLSNTPNARHPLHWKGAIISTPQHTITIIIGHTIISRNEYAKEEHKEMPEWNGQLKLISWVLGMQF